jgi:hypothetical protein
MMGDMLVCVAARGVKIVIEIGPKLVRLVEPAISEVDGWMEAGILLVKLRSIGINLLASEEDGVCLHTPFKVGDVEN